MHSFAHARHRHSSAGKAPVNEAKEAKGLILNGGWRYDLHGWLLDTCWFRGQGRVLRRRAATVARLLAGREGQAARFHAGGSSLHELADLVSDAGFSQVETEEMRPACFSVFPGAGFVRAHKR